MNNQPTREEFNEYFLQAQKGGYEVYLGDGAALVVYPKERMIGTQCYDRIGALGGGLFWDIDDLGYAEKKFLELRKPENRRGIQDNLTKIIQSIHFELDRKVEFSLDWDLE